MDLENGMPIQCFVIGEFFSICLPEGSTVGLENDETLAAFLLPDGTQLFAGIYPAPLGTGPEFAESELRRFMEGCTGRVGRGSYAEATDSTASIAIYQAVSLLEGGHWMIARTILKRNSENLLLMHWCGDVSTMRSVVLPALLSVELNY